MNNTGPQAVRQSAILLGLKLGSYKVKIILALFVKFRGSRIHGNGDLAGNWFCSLYLYYLINPSSVMAHSNYCDVYNSFYITLTDLDSTM